MKIVPTEDGSNTLIHHSLGEHYHSIHGALQESQHVFIKEGLAHYAENHSVNVFEMGFGTGLNALLAYEFGKQHQIPINYYSIEAYPLSLEESQQMNYDTIIDDKTVFQRLHEAAWNQDVEIDAGFKLHKIEGFLEAIDLSFTPAFDVIFYDAFAPSSQAHLWEPPILAKMYEFLKNGGHLTTYCAKGQFKRNLKSVGFTVKGVPGPPGKREMTLAFKSD